MSFKMVRPDLVELRRDAFYGPLQAMLCSTDTRRDHFPAAYLPEMREWLGDCDLCSAGGEEMTAERIAELRPMTIVRNVARLFDGGLSGFADAVWC